MNLFTEQVSALGAVGVRQLDTQLQLQLQLLSSAAERAFDSAEQLAALQFATTRNALDTSAELLRQVAAARDPRDLFALTKQARAGFDSVLAYQRRLFGIASAGALSGAVVGLPLAVTPTASAALQKLASLPAVPVIAREVVVEVVEVVEVAEVAEVAEMAEAAAVAEEAAVAEVADAALQLPAVAVDAVPAAALAALAPEQVAVLAPTAEAPIDTSATPIADLSAAPQPAPAAPSASKAGGRQRKK